MDTIPRKLCPACSDTKPITDFCKDKHRPDGLAWRCKACNSARGKVYRATHAEQVSARMRVYHVNNREQRLAKSREGYERNKPAVLARTSAYTKAHPEIAKKAQKKWIERNREYYLERTLKNSRAWRAKNRDKDRAAALRWIRANPERLRERLASPEGKHQLAIRNARRRERVKSVINTLTLEDWQEILARQDYTCLACRRPFTDALPPTRDHVLPVALGGALTFENTVALCQPCNSSKGTKVIDYR